MAPANPAPVALVHAPELQADGSYSRLWQLNLIHCTLVPGWSVDAERRSRLPRPADAGRRARRPRRSQRPARILGAVRVSRLATFTATDSILDATVPPASPTPRPIGATTGPSGGALTLVGCTVIGKVHATLFPLISDTILWAWLTPADDPKLWPASVDRRPQAGGLRPLQLSAHRRHHAAPLPMRREGPRRTRSRSSSRCATDGPATASCSPPPTTASAAAPTTAARWASSTTCSTPSAKPTCAFGCRSICRSGWSSA